MESRLILLLLTQLVFTVRASIFCPHPVYPSTENEFVVASIQTRQRASQEAYYRIAEDIEDPAFTRKSARFRLMTTRDSTECPFRGCLSELAPSEPKNHATSLYQTSVIGKMQPPGFFAMDVAQRLYCVITDGDCGATIPLYRHYRLAPSGIYHAYSVEADTQIDGYTKELTPLCYVWPKSRPNITTSETLSTLLPSLSDLLQRLTPKTTTITPSATSKESKNEKDSTEEEIRQENLNIVKSTQQTETSQAVEGSGAADVEIKEKKVVTKKVARNPKKKKVMAKDEPKKSSVQVVEKKAEVKTKKQPEGSKKKVVEVDKSKSAESPSDESNASDSSKVSAEDLLHPQTVLHFENVSEPAKIDKAVSTPRVEPKDEMPKPVTLMPNDSESVLTSDEDDERTRELAKFNGRKSGKEPMEIEEQHDDPTEVLRFEDDQRSA